MMKIKILSTNTVISSRDGIHNYFAWPTVTRLRDGRLAAVASGFRVWHMCPFGKGVISCSPDEGKTWSIPSIIFDTPLDDRDCGIVPFGDSGVLVSTFNTDPNAKCNSYCKEKKPKIGAYTKAYLDLIRDCGDWQKYHGSLYRISYNNGLTFGDIGHVPVSNPHGPALLKDGSFLWIGNRVSDDGYGPVGNLACYKLSVSGECKYLCDIENIGGDVSLCEPHTLVTSSGKIIVHIRVERPKHDVITYPTDMFTVYQCESYDGGKTFTTPHSIGLEFSAGAPPHIIEDNGVLISVYGRRAAPHQIRAAFSYDDGETWDGDHTILKLDDSFEDFGYPSSVVLKDGSILTVFYGGDEESNNMSFWTGNNTAVYEFKTPVVRQVNWRYSKD